MRYIDINQFIEKLPDEVVTNLANKDQEVVDGDDQGKQTLISGGNATWTQTKAYLEETSNRKCWYTESKNPGCTNDVEHFRPKGRKENSDGDLLHWYWFLAFDPENYRLSCQFSNRLNVNPESGLTGGKGSQFPLLAGPDHATTKAEISLEKPVLLDPCNKDDCELLEFQPDGRPVVAADSRENPESCDRVEKSKLLLNLDFPTFNEDREALYNQIKQLVERGDRYGIDNPAFQDIETDLKGLMAADKPYSRAAECYIRCFRDREWVEQLLFNE